MDHTAINRARTLYYGMFASFFAFNFEEKNFAIITETVGVLADHPIDDVSGEALNNMKELLQRTGYQQVKDESDLVFYSPTTSHIPMTASYYDEQRDNGQKRIDMMNYVQNSKFRRNSTVFQENEDHIEFIALFMQKLVEDDLQGEEGADEVAKNVFENILNQMLGPLCEKLYNHEHSVLYENVAIVLDSFTSFERLYLGVAKPDVNEARNATPQNKKPRKIKKAPKKMVERNMDEFVSI
ncbi:MAG: TorA maturation chaperone TorD [Desulforhopalus sp.]|jgi:TorA maturation chaperone TorD